MKVVPCEYRPARSNNSNFDGYWVRLWLLIEPCGRVYSFLHRSELEDNCFIALEAGVKVVTSSKEVLCCKDSLSDVYDLIKDYESR